MSNLDDIYGSEMVQNSSASPLPKRLGKNIAVARKSLGWTQAALAERMGMEPESISRIERGATLPSLASLERLADLLQTRIADLLAECPGSAYSEAQRLNVLVERLEPEARVGLIDIVSKMCDLIEPTARRR